MNYLEQLKSDVEKLIRIQRDSFAEYDETKEQVEKRIEEWRYLIDQLEIMYE